VQRNSVAMAVATATIALTIACVAGSAAGQHDKGTCSANHDQIKGSVLLQARKEKIRTGFGTADVTELDEGTLTMRSATAEEKKAFLDWTNSYRCMHGVAPVAWSDDVAANAAKYIGPMTSMEHSDSYNLRPPAGPAGENLYWASAVDKSSNFGTAAGAVQAWYSEVNYCRGGPTRFTDGCERGTKSTGHFTAMIWKGVKSIGCAFSNSVKPIVIICRYKAGDKLNLDTPNMKSTGNYKLQVLPASKTLQQCTTSTPAPAPVKPTPAPNSKRAPTPAPTPAIVDYEHCVPARSRKKCEHCTHSSQCGSSMYCCPYMKLCVQSSSTSCYPPIAGCKGEGKCSDPAFPKTWLGKTCGA